MFMCKKYIVALLLLFSGMCFGFEPFQVLPESPPIPADNLQSDDKIKLGKLLFFDNNLSVNGSLSCNSCHDLSQGGEDAKSVSTGATGIEGRRSTPTLWNVAYQTVLFWDGRASNLEQAIDEHIIDPAIMAMPSRIAVVRKINSIKHYADRFSAIFPAVDKNKALSYQNINKVLAAYIRSLTTPGSDFDRYLLGDADAMSKQAKRGFKIFVDSGCGSCHFWVNFSGPVPGLAFKMGEGFYELFPNYPGTEEESRYHLSDDLGRYYITNEVEDRRMWRVPILRNIAVTAPYFHNGSVATLAEAIRVMARTQLDKVFTEQQINDIEEFLHTLTGEFPAIK